MPKVNLCKQDPIYHEIKCTIQYQAKLRKISDDSLAIAMGRTRRTLQNRFKDMENMTLGELRGIAKRVGGLSIQL